MGQEGTQEDRRGNSPAPPQRETRPRPRPETSEPRRNPHPRIAAHHTPERVRAIQSLMAFLRDYRAAWQAWRQGKREQIFPAGTYSLRIYARVACMPACPA